MHYEVINKLSQGKKREETQVRKEEKNTFLIELRVFSFHLWLLNSRVQWM